MRITAVMKLHKFFILFFLFLFFTFPRIAFARENFSIATNAVYTIAEDTNAHAVFSVVLTNTSSDYYASQYKIELGFKDMEHITASDPDGPIIPSVTKTDTGYSILLKFNTKVVGINKELPFTMDFDTSDIAKKRGDIYEVNIPGVVNQDVFTNFSVTVAVPPSYGELTYSKPDTGSKSLTFSKEQLGTGGISLAFGQKQSYALHLTYNIENTHVFPIKTEIALPSDTSYQQVSLDALNPKPISVREDADGNWMALYRLLPSQQKTIVLDGRVVLSLLPNDQTLSDADMKAYLAPQPYWETKDPKITGLAQELKTPEEIYNYVVKTLSYDYKQVGEKQDRKGAVGVLNNPTSAVCLEFTDLFIALARAAGIPAREVNGYAATDNTRDRPLSLGNDILHAWPEYYDAQKQMWIMVDPTWGNTTGGIDYFNVFDFDHITFVTKGYDSNYPIPAGGYKTTLNGTHDVDVSYLQNPTLPLPQVTVTNELPRVVVAGFGLSGTLVFTNNHGTKFPEQEITVTSTKLPVITKTITVPSIPPFGEARVPISLANGNFLTNTKTEITIQVAGATYNHQVAVYPLYVFPTLMSTKEWLFVGGIFLGSITIIISIFALKSGRLPFFGRKK